MMPQFDSYWLQLLHVHLKKKNVLSDKKKDIKIQEFISVDFKTKVVNQQTDKHCCAWGRF